MKEKDLKEKQLLGYNDVFADVINGTIFEGKEVVKSEELEETATVTQFKDDEGIYHEQIRDVAKLWKKNGVIFSFVGIENQTEPDKDMILRICSYDGVTYKSQVGNERIYPVFTIVIYWGKREWKVPTRLKERLTCPPELEAEISDHKFKLIDMARLSNKEIENYKSDFSFIAGVLAKDEKYEPRQDEIKHPEAVLDLLGVVTDDKRFIVAKEEVKKIKAERGIVDMCGFLDKFENKGIEKGIEKGRAEGEEIATFRIARKFKESSVPLEIIIKATGLSKEQVEAL